MCLEFACGSSWQVIKRMQLHLFSVLRTVYLKRLPFFVHNILIGFRWTSPIPAIMITEMHGADFLEKLKSAKLVIRWWSFFFFFLRIFF